MSQTPNPMQRKSVLPEFLKNMFGGQGQQDGPMTPQTSPNLGMGAGSGAEYGNPIHKFMNPDKKDVLSLFQEFKPHGMEMGQGAMTPPMFPPQGPQKMGQGAKAASNQDPMDAMNFQQSGMDPRKRFSMRPMLMP